MRPAIFHYVPPNRVNIHKNAPSTITKPKQMDRQKPAANNYLKFADPNLVMPQPIRVLPGIHSVQQHSF